MHEPGSRCNTTVLLSPLLASALRFHPPFPTLCVLLLVSVKWHDAARQKRINNEKRKKKGGWGVWSRGRYLRRNFPYFLMNDTCRFVHMEFHLSVHLHEWNFSQCSIKRTLVGRFKFIWIWISVGARTRNHWAKASLDFYHMLNGYYANRKLLSGRGVTESVDLSIICSTNSYNWNENFTEEFTSAVTDNSF